MAWMAWRRKGLRTARLTAALTVAVLAATLAAAAPVRAADSSAPSLPDYTARVNDYTGTLSDQDKQAIESYLGELEAQTGAQGAVAVVATTAPLEPVEYKVKLFDKWHPGQKGKDNGFLILVAMRERRVEVATGYGLEGILPDAKVGRILDREVMPRFKQGDFGGGILAGAKAMGAEIAKESGQTPPGGQPPSLPPAARSLGSLLWLVILIPALVLGGVFLLIVLAALGFFRPRCPNCGGRMLVTDSVLRHATLDEEGVGVKTLRCPRCGRTDQREYVIHRQSPVLIDPNIRRRGGGGGWGGLGGFGGGNKSGGGWGGFGGGNTGGGGGGRSW